VTGARLLAPAALYLLLAAACGPSDPCTSRPARLARRASAPYVGRWTVVHGDTLTLPQMGDRFRLTEVALDTGSVRIADACRWRGALIFSAPRAETLAVTWVGLPEQAFVYGWPVELGPFGGLGVSRSGDSLRGALLFDSRLNVQVRAGVTAQFVAARAHPR
jgi:hypothetical protein